MTDIPGRDGWGTWPQHDPPGGPPGAGPGTPVGTDLARTLGSELSSAPQSAGASSFLSSPPQLPSSPPQLPSSPPQLPSSPLHSVGRLGDGPRARLSDAELIRGFAERTAPVRHGSLLSPGMDAPTGALPIRYDDPPRAAFDSTTAPGLTFDHPTGAHRPLSVSPRRLPPGPPSHRPDLPAASSPGLPEPPPPEHSYEPLPPWSSPTASEEFDTPGFDGGRHGDAARFGPPDVGASADRRLNASWLDTPPTESPDAPEFERPARVDSPSGSWDAPSGTSPDAGRYEPDRSWLAEPPTIAPAYDPTEIPAYDQAGIPDADPFHVESAEPYGVAPEYGDEDTGSAYRYAPLGDEPEYGRPYSGQPFPGWPDDAEPSPPRFDPGYVDPPAAEPYPEQPPPPAEQPAVLRRPTAPTRSGRPVTSRGGTLKTVAVIVLSALAIGAAGVGASRLLGSPASGKDDPPRPVGGAVAPGSDRAAPAPPERVPVHTSDKLSSRSTDPRPLAVSELGGPTYAALGGRYARTGTDDTRDCATAVDSGVAPLLASLGCSQVVSATAANGAKGCVVTFGALNLPDEAAAGKLVEAMRDGRRGSFVPRRHDKAAEGSAGGPESTWWFLMQPHGHWVTFATGAYASGKQVAPRDPTIIGCDTDLLRQIQRTLDDRAPA